MLIHGRQKLEETGNLSIWGDVDLTADVPKLDTDGFFVTVEGNAGWLMVIPFGADDDSTAVKTWFREGDNPKLIKEIKKDLANNSATLVKWAK
jgi:hypothetical protein